MVYNNRHSTVILIIRQLNPKHCVDKHGTLFLCRVRKEKGKKGFLQLNDFFVAFYRDLKLFYTVIIYAQRKQIVHQ